MNESLATSGTVVIGVGSPLMGDDGLGLAALEALREAWTFEPPVEFLDGGTWGMNLLPFIEGAEHVLLLDAIHRGVEPGAVVIVEADELPRYFQTRLSPHQVDLRDVIALAEFRGNLPDTVAMGIEPARIELSVEISPEVRARIAPLLDRVLERLEAWGHVGVKKASQASQASRANQAGAGAGAQADRPGGRDERGRGSLGGVGT
jgi:hydrogenase maturation protease